MSKRRTFSAEQKTKIALEALSGELTAQQIASKYKITTGQVSTFKHQAIDNMKEGFVRKNARSKADPEPDVKELHAKIGQLTMERDFLADGLKRVGISVKP